MRYLFEHEVLRVPILWESPSAEPWLISFDFVEQGDRLQCVGMEMRSYIKHEEGGHHAFWTGGDVRPESSFRGYDPQSEDLLEAVHETVKAHPIEQHDPHAYVAMAHENAQMLQPRVLNASTLRALPLAGVLSAVREQLAADLGQWGLPRQGLFGYFRVEDDPEIDAEVERRFWEAFGPGGPFVRARHDLQGELRRGEERRPGRPPKYSLDQLIMVADLYRKAYAEGLSYPTKYVARQLGINRNIAAKLVATCRRLGFLAPTEKRRAGGISQDVDSTESRRLIEDQGKADLDEE